MKLLHNPACSKSREALALLSAKGFSPELIDYIKQPLTQAQIRTLLGQLAMPAIGLVRQKESLWQAEYAQQRLDEAAIVSILAAHPALIERPILIYGDQAVIGRPIEQLFTLLDKPV